VSGIENSASSSFGPIPDKRSTLGESIVPAERMTSLEAWKCRPAVVCTPTAALPSKRTLATALSVRIVRFLGGLDRYAVAAVTLSPL
jgi:hypothetical protein